MIKVENQTRSTSGSAGNEEQPRRFGVTQLWNARYSAAQQDEPDDNFRSRPSGTKDRRPFSETNFRYLHFYTAAGQHVAHLMQDETYPGAREQKKMNKTNMIETTAFLQYGAK